MAIQGAGGLAQFDALPQVVPGGRQRDQDGRDHDLHDHDHHRHGHDHFGWM